MQNLSGYTFLVKKLGKVIDDVNDGKFVKEQVNEQLLTNYLGEVFFL